LSKEIGGLSAWRIFASTVPGMTAEDYRERLIHETPSIQRFLSDTRGERFIVSAPKGFGKSLLLIAKSIQVEEHGGGLITGSGGQIVDRPSGVFPNFSQDKIHQLKGDYQFWKNLWKISIIAASVKFNHLRSKLPLSKEELGCDERLADAILHPRLYLSAADFFTFLVEMDSRDQMRIIRNVGQLNAYFASIRSQTAMVIDNVDEYFKPVLEDNMVGESANEGAYYQSRSNDIWTIAQVALAGAAYDLHQANSHVKVYCSIRREAFLILDRFDDQYQQIEGATLSIEYDEQDYREIFLKNILLMDRRDLAAPDAKDPMERFLGVGNTIKRHRIVQRDEDVFAYLLRHTLFRPRDMMHIGAALAAFAPSRRDLEKIGLAVSESSKEIVKALITEMKPFFPIPDLEVLLPLINTNVIAHAELGRIEAEYLAGLGDTEGLEGLALHPFWVLYKIGLLGTVTRDLLQEAPRQDFLKPYEITIENGASLPTTEEFFLIHPALDQQIFESSGRDYTVNFHTHNIVGDGLAWVEPLDSYFVLKGDICDFSEIMSTELYPLLAGRIYQWAKTACETLHYFDVFGGDSVIFVDRSAKKVVDSAMRFLKSAREYPERSVSLRFGGSAGPISFQRVARLYSGQWQEIEVPLGLTLRHAARIEPFAEAGDILVDDEFKRRAGHLLDYGFTERPAKVLGLEQADDGRSMVRKNPIDRAYLTRLWSLSRTEPGS
jgi:hypothetical protein